MQKRAITLLLILFLVGLIGIAGCQPSQAPSVGNDDSLAVEDAGDQLLVWAADTNCMTCHTTQQASLSNPASQISQSHSTIDCAGCHIDQKGLIDAHATVKFSDTSGTKRLKKTEVKDGSCVSSDCHASMAEMAEITKTSTILTDSNGTTVNPHDTPVNEFHEALTCGSCHSLHKEESYQEDVPEKCISCHHRNVYECGSCHE